MCAYASPKSSRNKITLVRPPASVICFDPPVQKFMNFEGIMENRLPNKFTSRQGNEILQGSIYSAQKKSQRESGQFYYSSESFNMGNYRASEPED